MSEHTVASFDEELSHLDRLIREMGTLAGAMTEAATRALLDSDAGMAARVVANDAAMDDKQRELDERAITLIARRQPMAQDLRAVVGAIRMASDLERIGDMAKNIAKRVDAVGQGAAPRGLSHSIEAMAALVLAQVEAVIAHYQARDAEGLVRLRDGDEAIDEQYTALFRELLTYMMEDPRNITPCTHLLFCAKNLERIGDHVTNIAENAYYVMTGRQLPVERPKLDETGDRSTGNA
jgi:phosphate transport system protein